MEISVAAVKPLYEGCSIHVGRVCFQHAYPDPQCLAIPAFTMLWQIWEANLSQAWVRVRWIDRVRLRNRLRNRLRVRLGLGLVYGHRQCDAMGGTAQHAEEEDVMILEGV